MTLDDVYKHFGGRADIARALDISYQAVQGWDDAGEVPYGRQCELEILTGGQLKASRKRKPKAKPKAA